MKKIILSLISSTLCMSGWAACTYSFDATQSQIAQANPGVKAFPYKSGQKTSFKLQQIAEGDLTVFMANNSRALLGDKAILTPPSSGIFAYEYKLKVPLHTLDDVRITFFPIIGEGLKDGKPVQKTYISYAHNAGIAESGPSYLAISDFTASNGIAFPVTSTNDGYQRFGVYINQDTKQIGYIFNGVNKGYVYPYLDTINQYYFMHVAGYNNVPAGSASIGEEISIELITDKSKMKYTYPTGTKDICGNTL